MIPPNKRIIIIYIRTFLKFQVPYITGSSNNLTHIYPKDLMPSHNLKDQCLVSAVFCRETAKTQNGVFAEDTLPLMSRTYELPDITIYTINYMRIFLFTV